MMIADGKEATPWGNEAARALQDPNTLRELVFNIPEGIYITNREGQILDANPALIELLRLGSVDEIRTLNVRDLCIDKGQLATEHDTLERDGMVKDFELDLRRPDGSVITVLDTCYLVHDPETADTRLYGILIDITHRKQLELKLQSLLIRDPLTGCYNRRYLDRLAARPDLANAAWGAIVTDIDNFKHYNDRYGHAAGDEILIKVVRFLNRHARAEDAVIRIGGDEFLIVLLGESVEATRDVARRFGEHAAKWAPVPISQGWAVREPGETIHQTVARADRGLIHIRLEKRGYRPRRSGELKSPA
jgi:diguanylate cyclase (GGDEF)-like protein/PAS domain S-box-containing protein